MKAALVNGVAVLEDVPDEEKDWHPGSNKQVLDLVHPSLYCLRIDYSYARQEPQEDADTLRVLTEDAYMDQRDDIRQYMLYVISGRFQWLPTDFTI